MKANEELFYNIDNLKVVMINKKFIEYKEDDYINYFNENVKFIVEKLLIEDKDKYGLLYYAEYYTECITEEDLSVRTSNKPFTDDPELFSYISDIPTEYLTEEEIKTKKISVMRIFKILQDININRSLENNKVLKKSKKKNK